MSFRARLRRLIAYFIEAERVPHDVSVAQAAINHFENNKERYGMTNPSEELRVTHISHSSRVEFEYIVQMCQIYQGLDVRAGMDRIIVYVTHGLDVVPNVVEYHPNIDIAVEPAISSDDAWFIAAGHTTRGYGRFLGLGSYSTPRLVILPMDGKYYLCWRTVAERTQYFIDALSGDVLLRWPPRYTFDQE